MTVTECPNCGAEVDERELAKNKCAQCGAKLVEEPEGEEQ